MNCPVLAFVDLETTGIMPSCDRITEVGIVEVGPQGVSEWSSLVNPGVRIPDSIVGLTGISDAMVADAPSFATLASELHARLDGRLFIAHNARFDHGFLKQEFKRVGLEFRPVVLCTVKLSRHLYPGFGQHSLDAIIARHRLTSTARHRALGDARLIWQFWQALHADLDGAAIAAAVKRLTARPTLPSHLDSAIIEALPARPGVYFFYGGNDLPLYIGKAKDLRSRVLSHFRADHQSPREMELAQQVQRIDWIECAGEIGALLKEAELVKRLAPVHNQQLRRSENLCAWRLVERGEGIAIELAQGDDLFFDQDDHLFGLYSSARSAQAALRHLAEVHELCPVLLGLDKGRPGKPCFASQVKRCHGACWGQEPLASHRARLWAALAGERLQAWPFAGPIGIREGTSLHVIDGWAYLGTAHAENEVYDLLEHGRARFDRDVYRILHARLERLAPRTVLLHERR